MPVIKNISEIGYAKVRAVEHETDFHYYIGDVLIGTICKTMTKTVLLLAGDHHEFPSVTAAQQFIKKRFRASPVERVD